MVSQSLMHQKIAAEGFVGCWGELEQVQVSRGQQSKAVVQGIPGSSALQSQHLGIQTLEPHQQRCFVTIRFNPISDWAVQPLVNLDNKNYSSIKPCAVSFMVDERSCRNIL